MFLRQPAAAKSFLLFLFLTTFSAYVSSLIFSVNNISPFSQTSGSIESFNRSYQLDHLKKLNSEEIAQMMLAKVPLNLRKKASTYIQAIIAESASYGLDPFWVFSIMWTESHFNPQAVSPVGARGLMQIMPATFRGLLKEQGHKVENIDQMIEQPKYNIRYGVYYLRQLLSRYNNNYYFATLAYNWGPNRLDLKLKLDPSAQLRDHYYFKVKAHYRIVSDSFAKFVQAERSFYKQTYVYSKKGQDHKKRFLDLSLSSIVLDHQASKMI